MIGIARLCWRLDNDEFWAGKVIFEKYIKNKHRPTCFKKGSHLWRSIGLGWEDYKSSLAYICGKWPRHNPLGEQVVKWRKP